MGSSWVRAAACGIVLLGAGSGGAVASMVTHYYVSGPAVVSNAPTTNQPLLNTGYVTFDRSRAPGGSLANLEVRFQEPDFFDNGIDVNAGVVTGFDFALGTWGGDQLPAYSLRFDENEAIESWGFSVDVLFSRYLERTWSVSSGSDSYSYAGGGGFYYPPDAIARSYLTSIGYREGSDAYTELYCGSWVGQTCEENLARTGFTTVSEHWATQFLSLHGGTWFTSPLAFAEQVERNTKLALANPPVSYYDIPPAPIPLPPTGVLLLGAVALLGLRCLGGSAGR